MLFATIHDVALMLNREQQPSAEVLDSQTVKAPNPPGGGGYDAGKKLTGHKRDVVVDTVGRLLMVNRTSADMTGRQRD